MSDWRRTAKIISTTMLVTSVAWLIGGAILFNRMRPSGDVVSRFGAPSTVVEGGPVSPNTLASAIGSSPNVPRLIIPVAGVRADQLVDTFTQSREGGARVHNAIDILALRGTPVLAAAAGQVEKLFVSARGGNTIYVRSPDRSLIYYYAHLDTYAPGLAERQMVRQGQHLGSVGSTGDASPDAPHLHFEIQQAAPDGNWWQHTVQLNPYPLLRRQ